MIPTATTTKPAPIVGADITNNVEAKPGVETGGGGEGSETTLPKATGLVAAADENYQTNPAIPIPEPYVPSAPLPNQEATATGGPIDVDGPIEYQARTTEDILGESQQGLVSMLKSDNELMELARAKGNRLAEQRGLGGSSYAARASEGAAIDTILPLVQQATQIRSQEHLAAQSHTANSNVQASNRMMSALLQDQQLAVQSGDTAKARELEQRMQREKNELSNYMQARDLAVRSGDLAEARRLDEMMNQRQLDQQWNINERNLETQISENDLERKFRDAQQDKDIEYKQWLEQATFEHEELLRTSQQAMDAYNRFTDQAMMILNNEDSTHEQKAAAMEALREGLAGTLGLLEGLSAVDMSNYLPVGYQGATSAPASYEDFMSSMPAYGTPEYNEWYTEWERTYKGTSGDDGSTQTPQG